MATSITPVSVPHIPSQPKPTTVKHAQAPKPTPQPATSASDKVTLRSTQKANQDSDHG